MATALGLHGRALTAPRRRPSLRAPSLQSLVTFAVVASAVAFVASQLHLDLVFSDTTPAGGDMGAHVWTPAYVRDHLLPKGRITGWAPDWYAGFPVLHFYFPLPTLAIVALDAVLPYGVAFKMVTVAGVVSLPVAAWAFGRLSGLAFPAPPLLAVATLPFLFDRFHTIYGGNIAATLAGEFSFSISLSLGLVYLGVVARGLSTGRGRALAGVLLAATGLCHLLPTLFVLAGTAVLVALRPDRHRLRFAATALSLGALLAAFWWVPFYLRLPYVNDMGWEKLTSYLDNLFPFLNDSLEGGRGQAAHLPYVVALAVVGAAAGLRRRERTAVALTALAALAAAVFRFAPQFRLWNARVLPFWYLCLYLLAALGAAVLMRGLASVAAERVAPRVLLGAPVAGTAVVVLAVALPLGVLPGWFPLSTADRSYVPDWAEWNYSGYEAKEGWEEYRALNDTMAQVGAERGCGRALYEYEADHDRFGTPLALMLLPYWTDGCIGSLEGLYFESSATTPYHFLTAAEVTAEPANPQRNLPYRTFDLDSGVRKLQLLGVRYYLAFSEEARAQAAEHPDLTLVATSGPWSYPSPERERTWEVYEVAGWELVAPLSHLPSVVDVAEDDRSWLEVGTDFLQDPSRWDVPLAASGPPTWPRAEVRRTATTARTVGAGVELPEPERRPVPPATVTGIESGDDRIAFDVDRPGSPVLVKASYFPNWSAAGADGPYRVTPNLMVVVPTARHVELRYARTPADWAGIALSLLGVAAAVALARRGPLAYPEPPAPAREPDRQLSFDFDAPVEVASTPSP